MKKQINELIFVTSHERKAQELSLHLDFPVTHHNIDLPEIQSLDVSEVAAYKAEQAFEIIRKPLIVEDVGFRIEALGRLPGPFIKWFLTELSVEGVCGLLKGEQNRVAYVECAFAIHDGNSVQTFVATKKGTVPSEPKGETGFGTDNIFIPDGHTKTWGEMTMDEQINTSVRRLALRKLKEFLE